MFPIIPATSAGESGNQEGIFGYGYFEPGGTTITNLVSDAGVVATDVTGVGTRRSYLAATEYGYDKGIFGFGSGYTAVTNLVSNTGVVASDQAAETGTARSHLAACEYGGDKGIFGFGTTGSVSGVTNLVSNAGVVAADVTGVGTARRTPAACSFN